MPSPSPRLPEAEQDVLAALYQLGDATVREVRQVLVRTRPLAHSSIVTLLGRLEARGLVGHRKAATGKAFVYRATREKRRVFGPSVKRLLTRAFGGRPVDAMAALFETSPPTAAELDELQQLVNQLRRERR